MQNYKKYKYYICTFQLFLSPLKQKDFRYFNHVELLSARKDGSCTLFHTLLPFHASTRNGNMTPLNVSKNDKSWCMKITTPGLRTSLCNFTCSISNKCSLRTSKKNFSLNRSTLASVLALSLTFDSHFGSKLPCRWKSNNIFEGYEN